MTKDSEENPPLIDNFKGDGHRNVSSETIPISAVGRAVIESRLESEKISHFPKIGVAFHYGVSGPPEPYFPNAEATKSATERLARDFQSLLPKIKTPNPD